MATVPGDTARHVLARLRQAEGFVSGGELSRELTLSRMAVSKAVSQLRDLGYEITSVRGRGYQCTALTDKPIAIEVQPLLHTNMLGRVLVYEERVDSTNRLARELADEGAPDGLVVVADEQEGGRGRCRRVWHSPPGRNVYVSAVLRPPIPPVRIPQMSLVAAAAVRRALVESAENFDVRIKWPNDIWVGGRKLAGILCEMAAEVDVVRYVVIGIGINVNATEADLPAELLATATSLKIASGRHHRRPVVLAAVLNHLEKAVREWLQADDLTPFLAELTGHSVLQDKDVTIEQMSSAVSGRADGIDPDGRLRLQLPDGRMVRVSSGDAHVRQGGQG